MLAAVGLTAAPAGPPPATVVMVWAWTESGSKTTDKAENAITGRERRTKFFIDFLPSFDGLEPTAWLSRRAPFGCFYRFARLRISRTLRKLQ
jgi:hypothetical protein